MAPSTSSPTANTTYWTADQNETNNSRCNIDNDDWTFTFLPVYIMLISVLGIVLNVFVLMVFCLHKKACTTPEIYLSNMAAADLVLVSFLPFWAVYVSNNFHWTFGEAMCKIINMVIIMNSFCSIYFLVLVSMDRYLALVHPLSFKRIRSPFLAKLGCLLVWILGFSFSSPALVYWKQEHYINQTLCFFNDKDTTKGTTYSSLNIVFGFTIPVFIMVSCTLKIVKVLRSRPMEGVNSKKTDQKAATLVLAVMLAFLICWGPYHLVRIVKMLLESKIKTVCKVRKTFYICAQTFSYFAYFNSVLNPILYIIVGKNFRSKVKETLKTLELRKIPVSEACTSTNL